MISFLLLLVAQSAQITTFQTGNDLYKSCTTDAVGLLACSYYIQGVSDELTSFQDAIKHPVACIPSTATPRQLIDITVKHLREHPETRSYSAGSLIGIALGRVDKGYPQLN